MFRRIYTLSRYAMIWQELFFLFMFCYSRSVLSMNSANLTCYVDYHGDIKFKVLIPKRYQELGVTSAYLYYQSDMLTWTQEKECRLADDKKSLACKMRELGTPLLTFKFKISITTTNGTDNITNIHFADKQNYKIDPWTTMSKVPRCKDSIGVKYIALYAAYTNVTVEWIRYPLDLDYFHGKPTIRIVGSNINYTNTVSLETSCKKDFCTYTHQSLKPCSNYQICILTKFPDDTKEMCKNINTYCSGGEDATIIWQDTLLIVFGGIILITFVTMGVALFNKYKIDGGVMVDDTVTPRGHSPREYFLNRETGIYRELNHHVYQYPDLIKVIEADLVWTTMSNVPSPSPNMSSETMMSEC